MTDINWVDSIVWCNALTEYYNANNGTAVDLECVYSYNGKILRESINIEAIDFEKIFSNSLSKGFRLPSYIEWEFAARYRGAKKTNSIIGSDGTYYTKGTSASGALPDVSNEGATKEVAVCDTSTTAAVKSKKANTLGLFDMSGNVSEWCFDWHPHYIAQRRINRGGSYSNSATSMVVCLIYSDYSNYNNSCLGFRFCRTY